MTDLTDEAVRLAAGAIEQHCDNLGIEVPSPALARALAIAALQASDAHVTAGERSRLFVAIRHAIPLDKPWRGEAVDLIYRIVQQENQP